MKKIKEVKQKSVFLNLIKKVIHAFFINNHTHCPFLVCKNKVHNNENYNCIASRNYTDDDMETDICKSYSMVFVFSNIIWYNNSIYAIFR